MIGLLILMVTVTGAFIKYQERGGSVPDNQNWEQGLRMENASLKKQLEEMGNTVPNSTIHYYERQISLNEYRIEHQISPNEDYSIWGFVNDTSQLIDFAGLFTIIISGGIVASEFNWGTVKLLLIRPINPIQNPIIKISNRSVICTFYAGVIICVFYSHCFELFYSEPLKT